MRLTWRKGVGLIALVVSIAGAHPVVVGQSRNPLDGVVGLSCTFSTMAFGEWPSGEPTAEVKKGGVVSLRFVNIETAEGSADVIGLTASPHPIVAQQSGWNLHFLDIRPAGSLTITTVFGQESRDGKLKAVHSRTDYLPVSIPGFASQPDAFQYYGECEIGE